jgi:hypothetical protein
MRTSLLYLQRTRTRTGALTPLQVGSAVALRLPGGAAVAARAGAAQHLGPVAVGLGVSNGAHAAGAEAAGVVRGAQRLVEGLGLCPGREDRHVHVPQRPAPLRPDTVVLVLAARVGVHQQREVGAVLDEPGNHREVVVHRDEHA